MSRKPCCVPGCTNVQPPHRSFPWKLPHLYREWIKRVNNPKLFHMDIDCVFKSHKLCDRHFNDFNRNPEDKDRLKSRLLYCSVPTIDVPGYNGPADKENSFFYPPVVTSRNGTLESNNSNNNENDEVDESDNLINDGIVDIDDMLNNDVVESHHIITDGIVESHDSIFDSNIESHDAISNSNVEIRDAISNSNVESHDAISDSNVENHDTIRHSNVENCDAISDSNIENHDDISDSNVENRDKISHSIVEHDSMTNKSDGEDDNMMEIDDIKEEPLMEDPLGDVDEIINQVIMMEEGLHQRFIKEEPIDINDPVHVDFTMVDKSMKKNEKPSKENRLSLINTGIVRDRSKMNLKKNLNEKISSNDGCIMYYLNDGKLYEADHHDGDTETTTLRQTHVKPTRNKQTQTGPHISIDKGYLIMEHSQETSGKDMQSDMIKKRIEKHPLTILTNNNMDTNYIDVINTLRFHNYAKWDLRNLCRFCSKFDDSPGQMKFIFMELNLRYKIAAICPLLTLKPDDGLPQQICVDCYTHIEKAYEFYKSTHKYEKYLRSVLDKEVPTVLCGSSLSICTEENEHMIDFKGRPTSLKSLSIQFVIQKTNGRFCCPFCDAELNDKNTMMIHFNREHLKMTEDAIMRDICEENAVQENNKLNISNTSVVNTEQCIQHPQDVIDTNYISNVKAAVASITEQDDNYENVPVEQFLRQKSKKQKIKKPLAYLEDPLRCDTCYVTFATFQDKKAHDETHSARVFSCPSCSQVFSTANYVNEHSSMIHGLTTEECRIRSKKKSLLYECEHCASLFILARQLRLHRKECSRAREGIYTCRCTKVFHDFFTFFSHFSGSQPCFTFNPSRPVCKITHLCPLCFKKTSRLFDHVTTSHPEKVKELNIMDIPLNELLSLQT